MIILLLFWFVLRVTTVASRKVGNKERKKRKKRIGTSRRTKTKFENNNETSKVRANNYESNESIEIFAGKRVIILTVSHFEDIKNYRALSSTEAVRADAILHFFVTNE